jgi:hypothetical protein
MQLVTITTAPAAPASSIAPGTIIGRGPRNAWDEETRQPLRFETDVTAGRVLRAGVRDISDAAGDLMMLGHEHHEHGYQGLVGFIRNGATWDAVSLLAPERPGGTLRALWSVGDLEGLRLADGIQLDAVWQISDFGYDLRWGTDETMLPRLP